MPNRSVAQIAGSPDRAHPATSAYRVLYDGQGEHLPVRVIEASCFPWGKRSSWESCATDECIRLLSLGHFYRTELVRSFVRPGTEPLPTVYEVRMSGDE